MEEKEEKKVVKMNANKDNQKLSYEQLETVATQLSQQVQMLRMQITESNNIFKRLDYLLKVVSITKGFSEEFIKNCVAEIESLMTIPEEEEKEEPKEK